MTEHIKLDPQELADLAALSKWAAHLPPLDYLNVHTIEVRGPGGLIVQCDRMSGRVDYVEATPPLAPF